MSRSEWEIVQRVRRGQRVAAVRAAMGLSGAAFAERLQLLMRGIGWTIAHYDKPKVSRIESGLRDLSLDEAVAIAGLDPLARGLTWLATGDEKKPPVSRGARPPRATPGGKTG